MKKVMFGAAIAAVGLTTFATTPEAQVYDVKLSIKSTKAAFAKNVNNKTNPIAVRDDGKDDIYYRTQTSFTWKGLIWGCDCESIDGRWEKITDCDGNEWDTVKGCVIWDDKSGTIRYMGNGSNLLDIRSVPGKAFGWNFLQCIGKNGKDVEGVWEMVQNGNPCADDIPGVFPLFKFVGAGFGTSKLVTFKDEGIDYVECESYINKISGNFAGYMLAPDYATEKVEWGCKFCGGGVISGECIFADAWAWCEDFSDDACNCDVGLFQPLYTAAYGTWEVKYNSSLSKKLEKYSSITEAYKFSRKLASVEAAILAVEDIIINGLDCEEEYEALTEAEKVLAAAEKELEKAEKAAEKAQAAYDLADEEVVAQEQRVAEAEEAVEKSDPASLLAAYQAAQAATAAAQATVDAKVAATNAAAQAVATAQADKDAKQAALDLAAVPYNNMYYVTYVNVGGGVAGRSEGVALSGIKARVQATTAWPSYYVVTQNVAQTDFVYCGVGTIEVPINVGDYGTLDAFVSNISNAYAQAKAAYDAADAAVTTAQGNLNTAIAELDAAKTDLADAQSDEATAKWNSDNAATYHAQALAVLDRAQNDLRQAEVARDAAQVVVDEADEAVWAALDDVDEAQTAVDEAEEALDACENPDFDEE